MEKYSEELKEHKEFINCYDKTCYYMLYRDGILQDEGCCIASKVINAKGMEIIEKHETRHYTTLILRKQNNDNARSN